MFKLRSGDLEAIDRDSLRILAEIGVRVDDEALRGLALQKGALPGRTNDRVCFPAELVRECVEMAPAKARFADAAGRVTPLGAGSPPTFWTGAALNYVSGRDVRPITGEDLARFVRVADGLDGVFGVVGTSVAEVAPKARDIVGLRIMAFNTRKHLRPLLFNADNVKPMLEIAEVVAAGKPLEKRPVISFGYSCLSPLHWVRITTELWRNSSGHRIPLMINGEPIAGATSPVTLAGSLALSNAEILSGVVLAQLLEPGRPVIHNLGFAHVTDMRTGACLSGSSECALLAWAGARLAAYYKLPSASWMCTESFTDDPQSSMEKMLTAFAHVAGGVNIIWGMGQLESQKSLSPVQLVMDNEIGLALRRVAQGFVVDAENLAFEVIEEVVAGGGEFLSHEHTLRHFRTVLSESALLARSTRDAWAAKGATTLAERAAETAERILAGPPTDHLTDEQKKAILAIEQRELKRLGAA
jgi:trimethylamine--corrinoid protein Co-methyltransferase